MRGVASERYPLNDTCSHPECSEPAVDPHHIFPRSSIGNDSWFVEIVVAIERIPPLDPNGRDVDCVIVIPHVTGLCRAHHDDVEAHDSWIKLEEGQFVWYDRMRHEGGRGVRPSDPTWTNVEWRTLGPIDPQPAGREKVRKKRRKFQGQARRQRGTVSIRVPKDELEDGAGLLEDAIAKLEDRLGYEEHRPPYYTLMDGMNFSLLNMDYTDV